MHPNNKTLSECLIELLAQRMVDTGHDPVVAESLAEEQLMEVAEFILQAKKRHEDDEFERSLNLEE